MTNMMKKPEVGRQLKCECRGCGAIFRTSRHWIERGLPKCACGGQIVESATVARRTSELPQTATPEDRERDRMFIDRLARVERLLSERSPVDVAKRMLERYEVAMRTLGEDHEVTKRWKREFDEVIAKERVANGHTNGGNPRATGTLGTLEAMSAVCDCCHGQGVEPYYGTECPKCHGAGRVK